MEINNIISKKILTEAKGYLDIGFTHSLNPYSGCAFACKYCYVREMPIQKFKDIPWGNWLDIKKNAAIIYQKEVSNLRLKNKTINLFMSSVTDPYQPIERKAGITRKILEEMLDHPPDFLQIQTRSPLIARDLDLLVDLNKKCELLVSMTIETDREDIKRIFSPAAPGIKLRQKALKEVYDAGIATQAAISPVLPFTPDFPKILNGIVDRIYIDTLNIGDGAMGKRSERLGIPFLFNENKLLDWYQKDIHLRVEKYFNKFFPNEIIYMAKDKNYPMKGKQ
ncbi:radical SAM protein [Bacillus wiedmannii]|uniref:SPL family radical SAM protein n=1 Tax=Bacillus wiedmannii TaxID=1890302 RepID=UPI000BF29B68|nr:radical SAM protein [Bacillus wiedmannii]PGD58158.1 radical SAM protein [Bacillus wiedmannii]PHA20286.1 radical SAM protein [Bacillus wiedmannii]PHB12973.1 radical SAM protein [Bacillus wiedmannii]